MADLYIRPKIKCKKCRKKTDHTAVSFSYDRRPYAYVCTICGSKTVI